MVRAIALAGIVATAAVAFAACDNGSATRPTTAPPDDSPKFLSQPPSTGPPGSPGVQVTILSPIDAGTVQASPDQPSPHHTPEGGDWAADIAGPGAAYARFANPTGELVLTMEREYDPCGVPTSGGRGVTIGVSIDGQRIGTVDYLHLVSVEVSPGVIPNGAKLGDMITSAPVKSECWGNEHTHIEPRNQTGHGCFLHRLQNSTVDATTPLGVLGGSWADHPNTICATGHLDKVERMAGSVSLVGWARYAHAATTPIHVQALVDSRLAGEAVSGGPNPTVDGHGFDFTVPADGNHHVVCATALGVAGAPDVPLGNCQSI